MITRVMDWEENFVALVLDEVLGIRFLHARDNIDFVGQFLAVQVQRKVIDVVTKRVFDFATDEHDAQDYVRREQGTRNCDPVKVLPKLEG